MLLRFRTWRAWLTARAQSRQVLSQTEETGIHVLGNLTEQREALLRANNRADETHSAAQQAQSALTRMSRRACYNRLVLWVIVLLQLVLIGVVVYVKYIKK